VRVSKAKIDPNSRYPSNTKSEILNWNSAHFVKETHFALPYNNFTQKVNAVKSSFYSLP